MPTQLNLRTTRREDRTELIATGEIDLSNIDEFKGAMNAATAETSSIGSPLIVDLAAVEYVDSAAINVLSAGADDIDKLIVHPLLMTTFTVSGLTELMCIETASP
ncbi:STAS domain-containing protein [Mycolicibacterium sp. BiH015]|uniref:STAS domain-containing protein n=1 Tax=Mycolicibacterium sp. BiH015 TaxID=3018808 RepID=UPI0022E05B37|nr:STAS domain-containing protein [Mycolicibacterium sp. BiH015]MDA2893877.1 STAS domain-containing protein [Mycolicibacterium sp. BiH015]